MRASEATPVRRAQVAAAKCDDLNLPNEQRDMIGGTWHPMSPVAKSGRSASTSGPYAAG